MFSVISISELNTPSRFEYSRLADYDMQQHTYTQRKRGRMARRLSFAPVKEKAKALGIKSARQLARRSKLDPRTVGKFWFNRVDEIKQIDVDVLMTLADVLDCKPEELFSSITD